MEPIEIDILDHGKVILLDVFGDDHRIAEAARRSYQKGTKTVSSDKSLLRYMMKHRHTSPFEMNETLFYLKIPIFVMRQLVRHRTANINELSGRYSEMEDVFWIPELDDLGPQSTQNNQGRSEMTDELSAKRARQEMGFSANHSFASYDKLLNSCNVSREVARTVLPLSTYTDLYWKCDLHNFFHFAKLRMDKHAQKEIQVLASAMYDAVKQKFPLAAEAFEDYILYAHTLSRLDMILLSSVMQGQTPTLEAAKAIGMSGREYDEFMTWLSTITQ